MSSMRPPMLAGPMERHRNVFSSGSSDWLTGQGRGGGAGACGARGRRLCGLRRLGAEGAHEEDRQTDHETEREQRCGVRFSSRRDSSGKAELRMRISVAGAYYDWGPGVLRNAGSDTGAAHRPQTVETRSLRAAFFRSSASRRSTSLRVSSSAPTVRSSRRYFSSESAARASSPILS